MCRGFDPLFSPWQDRARSFWGIFLIHQQQSYLLGYKNYQFLQKSIFLAANSIFSSIFLGPIFSGQRHTPISFQAEYPPPPPPPPPGIKTVFPGMGIPMLKIRRSRDRLIFNMGIPILIRRHHYIEIVPRSLQSLAHAMTAQLLCNLQNFVAITVL